MFTKEDYNKWLEDNRNQELNKKMVEEFPFLLPRNRWTGEVVEDYEYDENELNVLPYGWAKAFGYELISELRDALNQVNYLDQYRIAQIKEKYGNLRWYDFGAPEGVYDVISKYCNLSEKICIMCGKPATHITTGWITYLCKECADKNSSNRSMSIEEYNKLWEAENQGY